jgi:hypothetical protein
MSAAMIDCASVTARGDSRSTGSWRSIRSVTPRRSMARIVAVYSPPGR